MLLKILLYFEPQTFLLFLFVFICFLNQLPIVKILILESK